MVFSVLFSVLILYAGIFGILNFLHMFQLNSYKPKEHVKWYSKNPYRVLPCIIILVLGLLSALAVRIINYIPVAIIFLIISLFFGLFLKPQKAKKPLVYTARVKRLLITCGIIYAVIIFCIFFFDNMTAKLIFTAIGGGGAPFLLLLCNYINKPIELSINRHYINDAKKILKSSKNLKIIGVTGSFGKTSVKFYLNTLLRAKYNVLATPESYNTPLGIVRTVREKLKATHQIFICEMGARNVGDIKEICDIVHPDHGVLTSIGEQHLETFKTLDNITKTKFELADSLSNQGMLFVNGDNETIVKHNHNKIKNAISYGLGENNSYQAYNLKISERGSEFSVKAPNGETCDYTTRLIGKHNVINIVGALAVSHQMGISLDKLKPQVRKLENVPHRLELINRGGIIIVDDAYNSNPSGARAALETIQFFEGMKILVTPGMVELGDMQEQCNYQFGKESAEACDYIVLVGEKQTKPIYDGVKDANYNMNNCYVAKDLNDALQKVYSLKTDKKKIVLLENDLPDNY